jgi:catechol 2,3-dioxygenase-like lactoylglutathione lyase family enzyme
VNAQYRRASFIINLKPPKPQELNMNIQVRNIPAIETPAAWRIDMKFEVAVIPVSDVDRAKQFYSRIGWRLDADFVVGDAFRGVQFTPPGSPASIHFGKGITPATPGSAQGLYLVVSDIEAARADLIGRGVDVSDVFHRTGPGQPAVKGRDPERRSYFSYATFSDPDGNTWLLQEVTARFPGRVDGDVTTFTSPAELARALRRAEAAHGEHEKRTGVRDTDWPSWYADYMVAEQAGKELPR